MKGKGYDKMSAFSGVSWLHILQANFTLDDYGRVCYSHWQEYAEVQLQLSS